jgi:NAD(P)H-hydrate epimerase
LVVDADALNLLAARPARREDWVLTPHPGEAARLLEMSIAEVQADRFAALERLRERYGGCCVLKGAGTLVQDGRAMPGLCGAGNPGMASGGMGDVLTGVIAGLAAQGLELGLAAQAGVCLHAEAGDRAACEGGERGLLAGDLMPQLRVLVNLRG